MAAVYAIPASDAFFIEWTPLGGGSRFSEVDDAVGADDGDTSYVTSSTHLEACSFNGPGSFSLPGGSTVTNVRVVVRARLVSGAAQMRFTCVCDGSYTTSPDSPITLSGTSYAYYWGEYAVNPATAAAWTQADIEGTGTNPISQIFGFFNHNPTGAVRVTQCYLEVNYTAGGGGGGTIGPHVVGMMRRRLM